MRTAARALGLTFNLTKKIQCTNRIALADGQFDRLVYQLYALTPAEIAVVEAAG